MLASDIIVRNVGVIPNKAGEELERMYGELQAAMGGKQGKTKIAWPVVLLLARRR